MHYEIVDCSVIIIWGKGVVRNTLFRNIPSWPGFYTLFTSCVAILHASKLQPKRLIT